MEKSIRMSDQEMVILVDRNDQERGSMEKMEAHFRGVLHRAFSVFVFHPDGRLLLQKRALGKYHSPGLWTNTCCSHQRPGESTPDAARRRLMEEMGMRCELTDVHSFVYKADVGGGLTEHEFDHILSGVSDHEPVINPAEVDDFKYRSLPEIKEDIRLNPDHYTAWFRIIFEQYLNYLSFK